MGALLWLTMRLARAQDADGDTVPDLAEDIDADGDPANDDTDGDGLADYLDSDDDGDALFTSEETLLHDLGTGSADPRDYDLDGDGLPNYLDPDDDDDDIGTICEITYGVDHLRRDADGDTLLDGEEWFNFIYLDLVLSQGIAIAPEDYSDTNGGLSGLDCFTPWDRDSDGIINALDADDDGDGLLSIVDDPDIDLDCAPGTVVPTGDGIPAYLDWDSDNDGILDDGTGTWGEGFGDGDGDNVFDFLDCDSTSPNGDSDIDGLLNDEDELICEGREVITPCAIDPDVDDDGVIDGVEVGSNVSSPTDTDGDLEPDVWDKDDDGDLRPSMLENGIVGCVDTNGDGEIDLQPVPVLDQSNPPGFLYWTFACDDANGLELAFDFGGNDLSDYPDGDGDGLPDFRDNDDDDDGLLTLFEDEIGTDPYNSDSDGDGFDDALEAGSGESPIDTDLDGLINAMDPDDDNDGYESSLEGDVDSDGDGIPAYLDPSEPEGTGGTSTGPTTTVPEGETDPEPSKPEPPSYGCTCRAGAPAGVGLPGAAWLALGALLYRRRRG